MYEPDVWVVVEIVPKNDAPFRKVLAGWYGGYLGADSWRLSSQIVSTATPSHYFEFTTASGAVYRCHLDAERLSGLTASIYQDLTSASDIAAVSIVPHRPSDT